mmetsp:Transcript_41306/g.105214  ORF Transcript_41306/g.105214 Transcript_41306/m.105214 type:complete len:212 (+) Transcript_41306:300-935(+)
MPRPFPASGWGRIRGPSATLAPSCAPRPTNRPAQCRNRRPNPHPPPQREEAHRLGSAAAASRSKPPRSPGTATGCPPAGSCPRPLRGPRLWPPPRPCAAAPRPISLANGRCDSARPLPTAWSRRWSSSLRIGAISTCPASQARSSLHRARTPSSACSTESLSARGLRQPRRVWPPFLAALPGPRPPRASRRAASRRPSGSSAERPLPCQKH